MKIEVTLTFEVDSQTWANEYGLDVADAQTDVQDYLPGLVIDYVARMQHVKHGVVDLLTRD